MSKDVFYYLGIVFFGWVLMYASAVDKIYMLWLTETIIRLSLLIFGFVLICYGIISIGQYLTDLDKKYVKKKGVK